MSSFLTGSGVAPQSWTPWQCSRALSCSSVRAIYGALEERIHTLRAMNVGKRSRRTAANAAWRIWPSPRLPLSSLSCVVRGPSRLSLDSSQRASGVCGWTERSCTRMNVSRSFFDKSGCSCCGPKLPTSLSECPRAYARRHTAGATSLGRARPRTCWRRRREAVAQCAERYVYLSVGYL